LLAALSQLYSENQEQKDLKNFQLSQKSQWKAGVKEDMISGEISAIRKEAKYFALGQIGKMPWGHLRNWPGPTQGMKE
jgi:hypothetical protein